MKAAGNVVSRQRSEAERMRQVGVQFNNREDTDMRAGTIVLIILRLTTLQLLSQGMGMTVGCLYDNTPTMPLSVILMRCAPLLIAVVISAVIWFAAPLLSRLVAGKHDESVSLPIASLVDLYSFALLTVGLFFTLSFLAPTLNWFHYFLSVASTGGDTDPERQKSFYEWSSNLVPCLAGLSCMLNARKWATKLAAKDKAIDASLESTKS